MTTMDFARLHEICKIVYLQQNADGFILQDITGKIWQLLVVVGLAIIGMTLTISVLEHI